MCKLMGNDTCRHISRDVWLIIIVWNGFFVANTSCCQHNANPVSWDYPPPPHGFPSPRIKYHMVKVPHLWDFSPPPSQQKSHMLSQYHICNLCWRRFAIEGEGLPYGIIFPGEVLPWDLFRGGGGKICPIWYYSPWGSSAIGFLPEGGGGGLPYGIIPPWGSSVIGFLPGGLPYGTISPWGNSAVRFLLGEGLPYGIPSSIWYNFRGENLPWYLFPYHEMCVCVGGVEIYHRGGSFTI